MKNKEVKKSLMYLSGEDFYLFCYAVFIALDSLNCKNGKYFSDYRKLAFLIEFIKDEKLNYIISNSSEKSLNPIDKEYLFRSYSVGLGRRSEILKLLFTLEKRNYVILDKGNTRSLVNVSLNNEAIPEGFFNKEVFSKEYRNMASFSGYVKRLSVLKLDTMIERVYRNNGISTWAI
ncbi:MAG: hypothetical protein KAR54_01555 [Candidatus Pacebacteria bacterium]|nr:hypothetical protein [Candidatus Paceibacterota bacterium]